MSSIVLMAALLFQTLPLQGVVIKKGTNEPLSKATVELRKDSGNGRPLDGITNGRPLDSITTEDDGRFSFGNVPPGRYWLTVKRRGYARPPLVITLTAGQPAPNIQLPMALSGAISGRVYDLQGRPMPNVEVQAMKASYPEGRRMLTPVQSVLTNDLGEYRLFWLVPGRYYVAAVHPKAQGMFRRAFGSSFGMSMIGPNGAIINRGKADPALGGFDPREELGSESERYAPIFFGGTADEQSASGIDLRENADFGGVNLVVAPVRARHVRGIVIDGVTGKPAQYGNITLPKNPDGPRLKDPEVDRETGVFDMVLFPRSYTLTASSASGEGYVSFTLGDADIENLTIATTPVFDIRGRIVVEGEPIRPAALEALHITLRRDPPRGEPLNTAYSTPLENGSFTVSSSAGDFRVNIAPILNVNPLRFTSLTPALQNAYVKFIRMGNADILNGVLHLDRQPTEALEVVIATNPGALDGQVVRSDRGPVEDIPVLLVPEIRRRNELYRTTTTDASGRFHFDRITPGDYKVFSWEEVEDGAWYDAEFLKTNESRGTLARIGEGRTETVRIEVIR
jgi:Carboxypeptidase regulatory-like domain